MTDKHEQARLRRRRAPADTSAVPNKLKAHGDSTDLRVGTASGIFGTFVKWVWNLVLHFMSCSLMDLLDYVSVVISVFDVVSDVVVARQFYTSGYPGWSYAVLASIAVSNFIYTLFGVQLIKSDSEWNWVPIFWLREQSRVLLYLLVFPFAQLLPLVHWAIASPEVQRQRKVALQSAERCQSVQSSELTSSAASVEEYSAYSDDVRGGAMMRARIANDFQNHWLFLVETLVESIPQCALQLLAASVMSAPMTRVQMLSLLLSFGSIASKAHFVSHSATISMYMFKFGLAVHDVASLFYLCSTILSESSESAGGSFLPLPFFPETLVSSTAALVVWKAVAVAALAFLFFLLMWALVIHEERRDYSGFALVFFGVLISLVPLGLTLECVRLSALTVLLVMLQPEDPNLAYSSQAIGFVSSGKDSAERERRLLHVYNYIQLRFGGVSDCIAEGENSLLRTCSLLHQTHLRRLESLNSVDRAFGKLLLPFAAMLLIGGLFSTAVTFWHHISSVLVRQVHLGLAEHSFAIIAYAALIPPLINARRVWWAARTSALVQTAWSQRFVGIKFAVVLRAYHLPSTFQLVRHAVPGDLVPSDPLSVVAALLGADQIDVSHWSVDECAGVSVHH